MAAGDFIAPAGRHLVDRALRNAEVESGFCFSVYIGASDGDVRRFARRLHDRLDSPGESVLVLVDPVQRLLEIVTGSQVRRFLADREVGLAALSMQTAFASGDIVGGIVAGVHQLGDHARRPRTLHSAHG